MTTKTKTEVMFSLVQQWKASGQTKQTFCSEHAINHHTLSYWVTKYNQSQVAETPAGFTAIDPGVALQGELLTLTYPNGVQIHLSGVHLPLISQLIRLG